MAELRVIEADCVEAMAAMDDASVDAICTDPPYGLEFMGKDWDRLGAQRPAQPGEDNFSDVDNPYGRGKVRYGGSASYGGDARAAGLAQQAWHEAWAREALRVLKPGGHLLAFGGTRTYHRLTCALEDAGFEIRDCLVWLYGSGFPKSLDVSKAIDKAAGAEREVVGEQAYADGAPPRERAGTDLGRLNDDGWEPASRRQITAPATPEAVEWNGWGTALKPAHEPIVLARKPLSGTVAANVLEHGTGAINVDGCRIEGKPDSPGTTPATPNGNEVTHGAMDRAPYEAPSGRWPANVLLDEEAAGMLDEHTGDLGSPGGPSDARTGNGFMGRWHGGQGPVYVGQSGGASRFFYTAKASRAERNAGLEDFDAKPLNWSSGEQSPGTFQAEGTDRSARNAHPTVKPIALMRWLVRLVTPPGGIVLDPFAGSGTTGCACAIEGFDFIGVEREPEYVRIAEARIRYWGDPKAHEARLRELEEDEREAKAEEAGEPYQAGLF